MTDTNKEASGDTPESVAANAAAEEAAAKEAKIERESVEAVFSLTGGELESKPWEPWIPAHALDADDLLRIAGHGFGPESNQTIFRYWYEGVPDYVGRNEFPDIHDAEFRTVVTQRLYESSVLLENGSLRDGAEWKRVRVFESSGETRCPGAREGYDDDDADGPPEGKNVVGSDGCPYCEEKPGEKHGYIYLGDGWAEVVYRREPIWSVSCRHKDTCLGDYLQDHHNRDGEMLLGASLGGTPEATVDDLWYEVAEIPDDLTEEQVRTALKEAVAGVDLSYIDEHGNPQDEIDEDRDSEEPKAWFVLSWERA